MGIKEIYSNLCYYDKRNPYYVEDSETYSTKCYCDNCFYGRRELAEEILKLKKQLDNQNITC